MRKILFLFILFSIPNLLFGQVSTKTSQGVSQRELDIIFVEMPRTIPRNKRIELVNIIKKTIATNRRKALKELFPNDKIILLPTYIKVFEESRRVTSNGQTNCQPSLQINECEIKIPIIKKLNRDKYQIILNEIKETAAHESVHIAIHDRLWNKSLSTSAGLEEAFASRYDPIKKIKLKNAMIKIVEENKILDLFYILSQGDGFKNLDQYATSYYLGEFLLHLDDNKEARLKDFGDFIKKSTEVRVRKEWDTAVRGVYGNFGINSVNDLQKQWEIWLQKWYEENK